MDARETLDRAMTRLLMVYPFWGSLLLTMEVVESETVTPTLGTDGIRLFYNPTYVLGAEEEILCTDLAHEGGHKGFLDCWRRGDRDPKIWNYATDYRINPYLKDSGLKLGDDYLYDPKYFGMDAEEIYDLLIQDDQQPEKKPGCACGSLMDHPSTQKNGEPQPSQDEAVPGIVPGSPMQVSEAEARVDVAQAAQFAKQQGNLPGSLASYVDGLINPKVRWEDIVRRFMEECDASDYSWHHPVRHMLAYNCYLPTLHGEGVKCFAISIDTSGSTAGYMAKFLAEVSSLAAALNFEELYVIYCDTDVFRVDQYGRHEMPIEKPDQLRQGGTSLVPPFQWLADQGIEPKGMCYLTDTYGNFPEAPSYPVLWAHANEGASAPFGELVNIA